MSEEHKTTAAELIGKHVLIGLTRVDHNEEVLSQEQLHGHVTAIDQSIHIRLSSGKEFTLPPDPAAFFSASPGEYRLRSSGEVVIDPDFTSTWTIKGAPPD